MGCKWLIGIHVEKFFFVAACSLVLVGLQLAVNLLVWLHHSYFSTKILAHKYPIRSNKWDLLLLSFIRQKARKHEKKSDAQLLTS